MVGRRQFLRVGGLTVVTAVAVACTGGDDEEDAGTPDTAAAGASSPSDADVTALQTASALELAAIQVYGTVLDSGLLTTASIAADVELFRTHHEEHARLFQSVIEDAGAEIAEADADTLGDLQPMIDALADEPSAIRLVQRVESIVEGAYRATVGGYDDFSLNQVAMTVGGVEARHAAVFAQALGEPPSPSAFQ